MIPGTKMKLTFADTLAASPLPFVLVASKCDIQTPDGPVESALGHYEIQRTSPVSPRSQKVCIAMVLRSVVGHKYGGRFFLWIFFLIFDLIFIILFNFPHPFYFLCQIFAVVFFIPRCFPVSFSNPSPRDKLQAGRNPTFPKPKRYPPIQRPY